MSLRARVLLYGVGLAVLALGVLGFGLVAVQRRVYLEEIERRARTFLDVLAAQATRPMAAGQIEALDDAVGSLGERDGLIDVRFVAIIDRGRQVLAHTDPARYGALLDDRFAHEAATADRPLASSVRQEGEPLLLVSTPIASAVPGQPGVRWGTALAGMGLARIGRHLRALALQAAAIVLGLVLIAAAAMGGLLERHLVRPVAALARAAAAFAGGDLGSRAPVTGRGELAELGAAFNEMADKIADHARGLEEKIHARTRELELANAQLGEAMGQLRDANARLEELATTDAKTGLHNYRHFAAALRFEVQRSQRTRSPFSLLMIDVDHFKAYNDRHGHPAGDAALRRLAELLRSRLRVTDIPARWGGEEFAVLLLDTPRERAGAVAESLRELVEQAAFAGEETQPGGRLTISIGVATLPADAADADGLVQAADDALYGAKGAGRNRVVASGRPGAGGPAE